MKKTIKLSLYQTKELEFDEDDLYSDRLKITESGTKSSSTTFSIEDLYAIQDFIRTWLWQQENKKIENI